MKSSSTASNFTSIFGSSYVSSNTTSVSTKWTESSSTIKQESTQLNPPNELEETKDRSSQLIEEVQEEPETPDCSIELDETFQESIIRDKIDLEEQIREQLYEKFMINPQYVKLTAELIEKLEIHFWSKNISVIEWTSFVNAVHNLFTQHIGKFLNKNKFFVIDEKEKENYFLFILEIIRLNKFFVGEIFDHWRENNCKTLAAMNNYWMVKIDKERLRFGTNAAFCMNYYKLSTDDLKIKFNEAFTKIFDVIFKILIKQNFLMPVNGGETQKPKYINNIQHFLMTYSKSKEWDEDEKALAISKKQLSMLIFEKLVGMKLISENKNKIEFNLLEISNITDTSMLLHRFYILNLCLSALIFC